MKTSFALLLLVISPTLDAGEPEISAPQPESWFTPLLDIRARYEFGEVDGSGASHAFTLRERIGPKTRVTIRSCCRRRSMTASLGWIQ